MDIKIIVISLISFCGIITFFLSLFSLKHRKTTGAAAFFGLMITITIYSWGYAFELTGTNLDEIITAVRIQYLALAALPVLWLVLAVQYTGFARWLTIPFYTVILIVPVATVILINTNEYHHMFYTSVGIKQLGPFTLFTRTLGIAFWIQFTYLNICTLAGNLLYLRMFLRSAPAYKKQAAVMFGASLFPWVINFLSHSTSFNPYEIDYNVYALALTSPFFAVAMFGSRILDLAPVARDRVFDSMAEPVFVFDNYQRIADINNAARLITEISLSSIGKKYQDEFSKWPELLSIIESGSYGEFEVNTGPAAENKWFMVNFSPFLDRNGQSIGHILIMRDISDKKSLEIQIFENEKRLKADIMKVKNLQIAMMPDFSCIKGFDIDSIFKPVDELSGDFVDGFFIDHNIYQIILCDVIDHGILPAFIGMQIRSMFRTMSEPVIAPSELISRVNSQMVEDFSEIAIFATVVVCHINCLTAKITISSAGHPPPLFYSAEDENADFVKTSGSLIGLVTPKIRNDIVIDMKINDILLLYTDGITEAMNSRTREIYGTDNFQSDFISLTSCSSGEILNTINDKAILFSGFEKITDDMTMICIKMQNKNLCV